MQQIYGVDRALEQSWWQEHYRLHCVEGWPDSPYKEVVLRAIHCAIERLEASSADPVEPRTCTECASRRSRVRVLQFPSGRKGAPVLLKAAA